MQLQKTVLSLVPLRLSQGPQNAMHKTNLRKVGGSIMLSVPPAILEQLHLQAGSTVTISLDGEKLVVESSPKPRYTLAELLAASD